ncbi:MAG: hypothetical protein Q8P16_02710 [bacterium]|nr:hypothetical protein [bacterium]
MDTTKTMQYGGNVVLDKEGVKAFGEGDGIGAFPLWFAIFVTVFIVATGYYVVVQKENKDAQEGTGKDGEH